MEAYVDANATGLKIAGAAVLSVPVGGTGKTVGEIQAKQAGDREYQRQMGQALASATPEGQKEFFIRSKMHALGIYDVDMGADPKTGKPRLTEKAQARLKGSAIGETLNKDIALLQVDIKNLDTIKEKYKDRGKDIDKYLSVAVSFMDSLNNNLGDAMQKTREYFKKDPGFTEFMVENNMMMLQAFTLGGKQLTPFEAMVTFGITPTGREASARLWTVKLDTFMGLKRNQLEAVSDLVGISRGEYKEKYLEKKPRNAREEADEFLKTLRK